MATKSKKRSTTRSSAPRAGDTGDGALSASVDEMLLAAMARGGESLETGRHLITYKVDGANEGLRSLSKTGLTVADTRDFVISDIGTEDLGDADAVMFAEIGVALVSEAAMRSRSLGAAVETTSTGPVEIVEPEYFVFADNSEYLRGFLRAAETIATDLQAGAALDDEGDGPQARVLGETWGLSSCRVPPSCRSGRGLSVAVLDTGMDLGHPDFAGRRFETRSFVGQPVQDLHSHGTHCVGTSCGPKAPAGNTPRYGIAHQSAIFVGKVLSNSGGGTTSSVLGGMNWAIANRCQVISMSLGSRSPVQAAYTAAGRAALSHGLLIVAAAGNDNAPTGAPANSPSIMSVASVDRNLRPSSFSNHGKIEIAAPGRDVFSSIPRPQRYGTKSGTSMATPHVAGCAALWAESDPSLRGTALWQKLQSSARPLGSPQSRVGAGLVQAP